MHFLAAVFALVAIYCAWLNHRDGASIRASADKASNARLSNITRWHKGALTSHCSVWLSRWCR